MASIYNIAGWVDTSKKYYVNDIVSVGDRFWYCIKDHTSSAVNTPEIGSIYWDGSVNITIAGASKTWPLFIWSPSYNLGIAHEPRVLTIQFGDGYEQRLTDGINNDKLSFTLNFDKRNKQEATAIIHFLASKSGRDPFFFKAPEPYGVMKKFICTQWSSTLQFDDNYTVSATFSERS
jgi:phage-related protein